MSCRVRDAGVQTNPYSTFMKYERNVTPPSFARLVDEAMCEGVRVESATWRAGMGAGILRQGPSGLT